MIPPELIFYAGVGAVAALLVWSASLLIRNKHRFAYRALPALVALLLVVALVLPDLKHSAGNAVTKRLFFALCGVALVAVIRLLWGAWQAKRWGRKLLLLGLAATTLLLIVFVTLPSFVTARVSTSQNACMAQLRDIQGAKETWAREHKKDPTDVPQPSDLIGPDKYLPAIPVCPLGGTYRLGAVRERPTCSISDPGHTLDFNR